MKIIDLVQGSQEWHDYRDLRIGASDAPIILGLSNYCTPSLLYKRKKKLAPPQKVTEAMQRGINLEPIARAEAEISIKMELSPAVVEMDEHPFLFASLDGLNVKNSKIIEIKCSQSIYDSAKSGYISPMYHCQMQYQMMVTGLNQCLFFAFNGFSSCSIWVERDDAFIEEMKLKIFDFHDCMQNNREPIDDNAHLAIEADYDKLQVIYQWAECSKKLKEAQKEEEFWATIIKDWGDDLNCEFQVQGRPILRMTRIQRIGNVDWKTLCVAKGITDIDIAPFRKKEIGYYKLTYIPT